MIAAGVLIAAYAAALFQARTRPLFRRAASAFVAERPYTFTRNPMYLGTTLVLFGFAVFFGSIAMLLAPIAYFSHRSDGYPAGRGKMERIFGPQYVDYKTRVRRWL